MPSSHLDQSGIREAFERVHNASGLSKDTLATKTRALDKFLHTGLAADGAEHWKYADLDHMTVRFTDALSNISTVSAADPAQQLSANSPDGIVVEICNGRVQATGAELDGLRIESGKATVSAHLADDAERDRHDGVLSDLNTAFLADVVVIRVCTPLRHPILINHTNDATQGAVQNRTIVRLDEQASATVIEQFHGRDGAVTNSLASFDVGAGASLKLVRIQDEAPGALHVASANLRIAKDANVDITAIELGSAQTRLNLEVILNAPGAHASIASLLLPGAECHYDHHLNIEHAAPDTTSHTSCRSVAGRGGRAVVNGRIHVHRNAQRTDASLENHNLVLHADSEVDTKPELEIYADDVRCSHGATTGQLDADALFYLQSRGIPLDEAKQLLVSAFVSAVTDKIELDSAHDRAQVVLGTLLASETGVPLR
jgi:Fe-S cluster assembly protein SufD